METLRVRDYLAEIAKKFPGLFLERTILKCDYCELQAQRLVGDMLLCKYCTDHYLGGTLTKQQWVDWEAQSD